MSIKAITRVIIIIRSVRIKRLIVVNVELVITRLIHILIVVLGIIKRATRSKITAELILIWSVL